MVAGALPSRCSGELMDSHAGLQPTRTAGLLLGIGLGGFVDGIALHQIAQWHNMGSAVLPPVTMEAMSRNMMWDGMFHAATWIVTLIGVFMLWSAAARRAVPATAA